MTVQVDDERERMVALVGRRHGDGVGYERVVDFADVGLEEDASLPGEDVFAGKKRVDVGEEQVRGFPVEPGGLSDVPEDVQVILEPARLGEERRRGAVVFRGARKDQGPELSFRLGQRRPRPAAQGPLTDAVTDVDRDEQRQEQCDGEDDLEHDCVHKRAAGTTRAGMNDG